MSIDLNNNNGSTEFLNFSEALNHLRWGERIARRQWKEGQSIRMNYTNAKTRIDYTGGIYDYPQEWKPSTRMLVAEDWFVLSE